jgi:hypothetical protein
MSGVSASSQQLAIGERNQRVWEPSWSPTNLYKGLNRPVKLPRPVMAPFSGGPLTYETTVYA